MSDDIDIDSILEDSDSKKPTLNSVGIYLFTDDFTASSTAKVIREILMLPQDVWLSANEAVKYGIADNIRNTY